MMLLYQPQSMVIFRVSLGYFVTSNFSYARHFSSLTSNPKFKALQNSELWRKSRYLQAGYHVHFSLSIKFYDAERVRPLRDGVNPQAHSTNTRDNIRAFVHWSSSMLNQEWQGGHQRGGSERNDRALVEVRPSNSPDESAFN